MKSRNPESSEWPSGQATPSGAAYHYSREERLAGRPEREEVSGNIFQRNRSLAIILLDVSVVLLMFLLYLFLFRPTPERAILDAYEVTASAFRFDDEIYITVTTMVVDEERPPVVGEETLITIDWPDGSSTTDALPVSPEFPTVTRHVIPDSDTIQDLELRVQTALERADLTVTVRE